jgi:hypothetical protein
MQFTSGRLCQHHQVHLSAMAGHGAEGAGRECGKFAVTWWSVFNARWQA